MITYTSLTFDQSTGIIRLTGTADCNEISARIVSPNLTVSKIANVDQNGNWSIEYSGIEILISSNEILNSCGNSFKIDSFCTNEPNKIKNGAYTLECIDNDKKCPEVRLSLIGISNNCEDGINTAEFEVAFINPSLDSIYEFDFGDGNDEIIYFNPNQNPLNISHNYSGGNYTVLINSILPRECPSSNEIQIEVTQCDEICPNIELELGSISECNSDGTRTVIYRVNISNVFSSTYVYEIDFGDGTDQNIIFDSNTNSSIEITHDYLAGNYSSIINSVIPEGCPSSNSVFVTVRDCDTDCANDVNFEIIDSNGNRFSVVDNNGVFEAVANNPSNQQLLCLNSGRYILRAINPTGQGLSYVWREDENPPVESNSRDFTFSLTNNEDKTITVIVKKNGCTDLPESVRIRECSSTNENDNNNDDNDNNNDETGICDSCCWWFYINIGLVFATLISIVIAGCLFQWSEPFSIGTAIGLALATSASIIAWGIFCRGLSGGSCRPLLRLIDLLDLLAILAGILAFLAGVLSPCAVAFWINVGLLQWFRRILQTIAEFTGCIPNPWFRVSRR